MGDFLVEAIELQQVGSDWKWRRIGQIDEYLNLDIIVRYNDVASWTLRLMSGTPQASLLGPGKGIVIWYRDMDQPILSGPVRSITRWSDDTNTGPGSIDFSGMDFNTLLAEKLCFPGAKWQIGPDLKQGDRASYTDKVTYGYDGDDTNVFIERFFYETATFNFGPANLAGRTERGVDLPLEADLPDPGLAPYTTYKLRFDVMLDAFKQRAETPLNADGTPADPYGFQMMWNPSTEKVELQLYRPRQRGELVRFSKELGNLQRFYYTIKAAKANRIIIGLDNTAASGDLPSGADPSDYPQSRNFVVAGPGINPFVWDNTAYGQTDEWGNISEAFDDRRDINTYLEGKTPQPMGTPVNLADINQDAINQAVQQDITDNGPVAALSIEPIDTASCQFGRDYYLGDRVTVIVDTEEITDVLREVHLTDSPDSGPTVVPTIGTGDASETPVLYQEIRKIWNTLRTYATRR